MSFWPIKEKRYQDKSEEYDMQYFPKQGAYWKRYHPKKKASRWNLTSRVVVWAVGIICGAVALLFIGCATKHLSYSSIDANGKPYTISADIAYLFTDQNTSGFAAEIPGGLKIMFDAQGSQAKTEFLTEVLKAYNKVP